MGSPNGKGRKRKNGPPSPNSADIARRITAKSALSKGIVTVSKLIAAGAAQGKG